MIEEVLQPNHPATFSARNLRPKFRRLKAGDIFLAEIEIDEAVWNQLRTVPENALLEIVLWHHDGDGPVDVQPETNGKPAKESKGENSLYWQQLFKKGFNNFPDLIQVLECAGDQVRLRLHDIFEVDSLSKVSPQQFEDWCASEGLHSLITLSRQARAKLEEQTA